MSAEPDEVKSLACRFWISSSVKTGTGNGDRRGQIIMHPGLEMVTGRGRSSCISSHIDGLDKQEKIKGRKIRCWHVDFVIKIVQVEEVSWIVSCIFSSFLRLLHIF